jgi:hypothetical protein
MQKKHCQSTKIKRKVTVNITILFEKYVNKKKFPEFFQVKMILSLDMISIYILFDLLKHYQRLPVKAPIPHTSNTINLNWLPTLGPSGENSKHALCTLLS